MPADQEANKTDADIGDNEGTSRNKSIIVFALKCLLHVLVLSYFAGATYYYVDVQNLKCSNSSIISNTANTTNTTGNATVLCGIQFCNGYGMLLLLMICLYVGLFYYLVFKPKLGKQLDEQYLKPLNERWMEFSRTRLVSGIMIALGLIVAAIFLLIVTWKEPRKLIALTAPTLFILIGYLFSYDRKAIRWRLVISGTCCQFLLGIFCIYWHVGRTIFSCIGNKVAEFLFFTNQGSRFVFGSAIIDAHVFAFAILSVIFFFSFFISILYYLGVMQCVVQKLGWILQQIMGTTVCESVNAAANIFLGMSETPFLIRPYIKLLTASEIHAVMVAGFATVSGTVLAAYLSFGASAANLITASVMAAPGSLALSKLYMPETEESQTTSENIVLEKSKDSSILDAAVNGATNAIPIVLGITANIIAFIAFLTFLNAIVRCMGVLVGMEDLDFELIFSKLFIPIVWTMGVDSEDCDIVAKVVATKTIINEFVAFKRLGEYAKNGDINPRSTAIATIAICGFANPGSLGILIGSLSGMAPERRVVITTVAIRAFIVGCIVSLSSASYAALLIQDDDEKDINRSTMQF